MTSVPVTVIFEEWRQDQVDGTVVKVGDRIAKIRGTELGFEPSADDQILIAKSISMRLLQLLFGEEGEALSFANLGTPMEFGFSSANAQLWMIKGYKADPAGVVFDIHVRAHQ